MDTNGTIASLSTVYQPVIDPQAHPPVLRTVAFKAGGLAYGAGEALAFDGDGYAVSYDPDSATSTKTVVGVLTEPVDASGAVDVTAKMLWHGAVKRGLLTVEGGTPAATDFGALENTNRIFLG